MIPSNTPQAVNTENADSQFESRWQWALVIYVAIYLCAWIVVPLLVNTIPPGDNLEQLDWAQHLAWGYSKHPPFPTLVLWIFEHVFPTGVPLTHVLGGLDVLAMLGAAWLIVKSIFDRRAAFAAVLWISCITYYTNRLHFYNHNTALMVAYAASVFICWRAARSGKTTWFMLLGIAWGVGMLSKYQMVIGIACNVVYFWSSRERIVKSIWGLCIAAAICIVIITPHVVWLVENHFPSFTYAANSVAAHLPWLLRPSDIAGFLGNQIGRLTPLAALLFIFSKLRLMPAQSDAVTRHNSQSAMERDSVNFFAIHAWGPFILMTLLSLLFGMDLQMHWGTAFLWMLPLWFLTTQRGNRIAILPPSITMSGVAILQLVSLIVYR